MKTILLAYIIILGASISASAESGGLSDLGGKKWGFQGTPSNAPYLVFKQKQLLFVQECGSGKMIQKFDADVIGTNTIKLSDAGTEGQCNPHYAAGFKPGSIVSVKVRLFGDRPAEVILEDQRPNEQMPYMSMYKEMK